MLERIITALVLVAVVLSCMFATQSHYPMFMLMIVAAGVAGYELPLNRLLHRPVQDGVDKLAHPGRYPVPLQVGI